MIKGKKYLTKDGYETLQYPSDCMRITQGCYGSYSHTTVPAIDDACGERTGISYEIYAPCTMKCVAKDTATNGNAVWFESVGKVYTKNDKLQKVTMMMIHTNDSSWLKIGMIINQGDICYNTGVAGKASGPHLHFEIAEGAYTRQYYNDPRAGATAWSLPNCKEPYELCFVNDCKIVNGEGYDWKTYMEKTSEKKFVKENGAWYLKQNGTNLLGWQWAIWNGDSGAWYYFNPSNGIMMAGTDKGDYPVIDNGTLYLVTKSGKMRVNGTVTFVVGSNGACAQK